MQASDNKAASHDLSDVPVEPAGPSLSRLNLSLPVIRGSLWSLGGQAAALFTSLIATPFVIRLLGPEQYGVWALINLLLAYLAYADLGMSTASTRFGSKAHASSDSAGEAASVWTSLLVLAFPLLLAACVIGFFAEPLTTRVLRLPSHLHGVAVTALRLVSLTLIVRGISGVANAPQLIHMRLDLYTMINAGGGATQIALVPLALFLGGGLEAAVTIVLVVGVAVAVLNISISKRLLPSLLPPHINSKLIWPMVRFGAAQTSMGLVGVTLTHVEKLLLVRMASVRVLGYYSVAYALASLLNVPSAALGQPLLPAFSRLQSQPERQPVQDLYTNALRILLFCLVPPALFIWVGAHGFLNIWAGPEYGHESVLPLQILLLGSLLDGLSFVPRILLSAVGRPNIILRFQLMTLPPYILVASLLIPNYGAVGAAIAWSARAVTESVLMFRATRKTVGVTVSFLWKSWYKYGIAFATLVFPLIFLQLIVVPPVAVICLGIVSLIAYVIATWVLLLSKKERTWVETIVRSRSSLFSAVGRVTG